LDRASAF